jgi:hypothetical protein
MACANCSDPALGELCEHCSGARARPPTTTITAAQWDQSMREAAAIAIEMLARDKAADPLRKKPGPLALAHLLAAQSIIGNCGGLPSLEWYTAMVLAKWHESHAGGTA